MNFREWIEQKAPENLDVVLYVTPATIRTETPEYDSALELACAADEGARR